MKKLMMVLVVAASVLSLSTNAQLKKEPNLADAAVGEELTKIPVNEVPEVVMNAIKAQEKGIFFTEAERFWRSDLLTYQVVGRRFSEEWTFIVVSDGTVLSAQVDGR